MGKGGVWPVEIWRCVTEHGTLRNKMDKQPIGIVPKLRNQETSRIDLQGLRTITPIKGNHNLPRFWIWAIPQAGNPLIKARMHPGRKNPTTYGIYDEDSPSLSPKWTHNCSLQYIGGKGIPRHSKGKGSELTLMHFHNSGNKWSPGLREHTALLNA